MRKFMIGAIIAAMTSFGVAYAATAPQREVCIPAENAENFLVDMNAVLVYRGFNEANGAPLLIARMTHPQVGDEVLIVLEGRPSIQQICATMVIRELEDIRSNRGSKGGI